MRSTSKVSPILTLPSDVLNEIALRLPVVKSAKPWQDVNSMAKTCTHLRQWKKNTVDKNVQAEWKKVREQLTGKNGWSDALQVILFDFDNPQRRLFREPLLRAITKNPEPLTTAKPMPSIKNFDTNLYLYRESLSLKEIRSCFRQCSDDSFAKKLQLIEKKFPSFLSALNSLDRQTALRKFFRVLDKDKYLGESLELTKFAFKDIKNSLRDDQEPKILMEIGLYCRGLWAKTLNLSHAKSGLSHIPSFERWDWVKKNVPEFLDSSLGLQVMLDDPSCRKQMIDHLELEFLKCKNYIEKFNFCRKISNFYSELCVCHDGKKFTKKLAHFFLKGPIITSSESVPPNNQYMELLIKHITLINNYLGSKEKAALSRKISQIIKFTNHIKAFDHSTSLLLELTNKDIKLFKKIIIDKSIDISKFFLKNMLNGAAFSAGIENRRLIISILCQAAKHYFYFDREFVGNFIEMANARLELLAKSLKKHD